MVYHRTSRKLPATRLPTKPSDRTAVSPVRAEGLWDAWALCWWRWAAEVWHLGQVFASQGKYCPNTIWMIDSPVSSSIQHAHWCFQSFWSSNQVLGKSTAPKFTKRNMWKYITHSVRKTVLCFLNVKISMGTFHMPGTNRNINSRYIWFHRRQTEGNS